MTVETELLEALARMATAIEYDDPKHSYTVGGRKLPSVTGIIEQMFSKPALVQWAASLQYEATRGAVDEWLRSTMPGQLGSPASVQQLHKALKATRNAPARNKGVARDLGKEAHALIEWHSHLMLGRKLPKPKVSDEAAMIFASWQEWALEVGYRPIAVEARVYHDTELYAGTIDAIAEFKGFGIAIADWKSGKRLYLKPHGLQLEAYARCLPGMLTSVVVRLPKEDPLEPVEAVWIPRDDKAWECFKHMRQAYEFVTAKVSKGGGSDA